MRLLLDPAHAKQILKERERSMAWLGRQVGLSRERIRTLFTHEHSPIRDKYANRIEIVLGEVLFTEPENE